MNTFDCLALFLSSAYVATGFVLAAMYLPKLRCM